MSLNFLNKLNNTSHSSWYWSVLLLMSVGLLSVALIYQHVLNEQPCLLCIQIRLWVTLLIIVSFTGLVVRQNRILNSISHMFVLLVAIGLVERSYQLLGTERGFVFGDCGFDLGLPVWFAVDEWLPSVYYVQTSCGYTPEIIFGITMAEALMLFSVCLLLLSAGISFASFFKRNN